jgi:hypothetical protein
MKKFLTIIFVAIMLTSAHAMAASVTITQGSVHSAGGGGPFTLQLTSNLTVGGTPLASAGSVFISFCVEYSEHISLGGTYNAEVNLHETVMLGGTETGDPLSQGAAWLLSQHYYDALDNATATGLQQAIWWLEGEITLTDPLANSFLNGLVPQFISLDAAKQDAALGLYGVYVLNLTNADGSRAQDQIIMVPTVPDGGLTVMLLGLGVGGLALFSRKFKQ